MSTRPMVQAVASPALEPHPAPSLAPNEVDLRVIRGVQQAVARPKVRNWLIVAAVVFVVLVAQLLLSILLAQGSYETSALEQRQKQLSRTTQELTEKLTALESPQYLTEQATKLGMVNSTPAKFLRLSDASILGSNKLPEGGKQLSQTTESLVTSSVIDASGDAQTPVSIAQTEAASATSEESADESAASDATGSSDVEAGDGAPQWLPSVADVDLAQDQLPTPVTR